MSLPLLLAVISVLWSVTSDAGIDLIDPRNEPLWLDRLRVARDRTAAAQSPPATTSSPPISWPWSSSP